MTTPNPKSRREVKAMSEFCIRPAKLRAGMTLHDLERIAYGGEEIGEHEFRDGKCVHCGVITLTESNAQRGEE